MSSVMLAQLHAAEDPAQAKSELLTALDQLDQALRDELARGGSQAAEPARAHPGLRDELERLPRDHLHGAARLRALAHPQGDAAHEADAAQARREPRRRMGRHRRRRRGQGGADRGRRVPARPEALPPARRARPPGSAAARAAGHRQDAAREGGRPRVPRAVLLAVGVLVRRDVRGPRRRAHPAPLQRGAQGRACDRLHRRARRGRRQARLRPQLRARADAQPAAGRDGRLLVAPTRSS